MPRVWISVGSNIDRESHVAAAIAALRERFGAVVVSPVYETPAVGFEGDAFYNLVVGIDTTQAPAALHRLMREIEDARGRRRDGPKFGPRTLDLDLLTYGDAVTDEGGRHLPRYEIERYAFVLGPLADVAPDERHPETGLSYREHWARFDAAERAQLRCLGRPAWLDAGAT